MEFDLEEFIKIIIPVFLQRSSDYYVKGGRAHDIYFKKNTNSLDWDIVGTEQFYLSIKNFMGVYATKFGLNVKENYNYDFEMYQLGFEDYLVDNGDPFFIDVNISKNTQDYTLLNNIRYMTMEKFLVDLITSVLPDRYQRANQYYETITNKPLKVIAKFAKSYKLKIPKTDITFENVFGNSWNQVVNYVKTNLPNEIYENIETLIINKINSEDQLTYEKYKKIVKDSEIDDYMEIVEDADDDENTEKLTNVIDLFRIDYDELLFTVANLYEIVEASEMIFRKYKKTVDRYNNIIDITWDNLSDIYKMYIVSNCSKDILEIYNISDTCTAYINCDGKSIIKNTKRN
jgi:hypothetical protein